MEDISPRTLLIATVAPLAWGTTYLTTELFLPPDRPLFSATVRALPAGLLLLAFTRQLPRGIWWWRATVLGLLNIGMFFPMIFLAAYHLPGGLAATVTAASPLVVMAVAWAVIHERPGPVRVVSALVGLTGVGLLVLRSPDEVGVLGLVGAFGAVLLSAVGFVLIKHWPAPVDLLTLVSWQLVVGGLALLPVGLLVEGGPPALDARAVGGYLWLGGVGTVIAYASWFHALSRMPAGAVSLVGLLNPVMGTTLGVVVVGEAFGPTQAVGMFLVLGGVLAGQPALRRRRQRRSQRRPEAELPDLDPHLVRDLLVVAVAHPEPVHAAAAGLHVGGERLVADRGGDRELLPGAVGEPLDLEDRALTTGVDPGEVDLLHRGDLGLPRRE